MTKNLTNSYSDRQKILNNPDLLSEAEKHFSLHTVCRANITYKEQLVFSKRNLEYLFDIGVSVINKCVRHNLQELKASGYILEKNEQVQEVLKVKDPRFIKNIELFPFKAMLNLAMLLPQSTKAEFIRLRILDLYIDLTAIQSGNAARYINSSIGYFNQPVACSYLIVSNNLEDAIHRYTQPITVLNSWVYSFSLLVKTRDSIYGIIFEDRCDAYRQSVESYPDINTYITKEKKIKSASLTNFSTRDRVYFALCYEIRGYINRVEYLVSEKIRICFEQKGAKIELEQLEQIFVEIENNNTLVSLAREIRQTIYRLEFLRDNPESLPEVMQKRWGKHYKNIAETDLEEFISAKSKSLKEKLSASDTIAVFKRLQD